MAKVATDVAGRLEPDKTLTVPVLMKLMKEHPESPLAVKAMGRVAPRTKEGAEACIALLPNADHDSAVFLMRFFAEVPKHADQTVPAMLRYWAQRGRPGSFPVGLQTLIELGAAAIPPLEKCLTDDDVAVRLAAAEAFQFIKPSSETAVKTLIAALNDSDQGVRRAAVKALASVKGPRKEEHARNAAPHCMKFLLDDEVGVRCARALSSWGFAEQAAESVLEQLKKDDSLRAGAARALRVLGREEDATKLSESLKRTPLKTTSDPTAAGRLAGVRDNAARAGMIRGGVRSPDRGLRVGTATKALVLGSRAAPLFAEVLSSEDPQTRKEMAEALIRLNWKAAPATDALLARLGERVRFSPYARALGGIGPPAIPGLVKAATSRDYQVQLAAGRALRDVRWVRQSDVKLLMTAWESQAPEVQRGLLNCLREFAADDPEVQRAVIEGLDHRDRWVRWTAAMVMVEHREHFPVARAAEVLGELFRDSIATFIHKETLIALATLGEAGGPAAPGVVEWMTTPPPPHSDKEAATRALKAMGLAARSATPQFRKLFQEDPKWHFYAAAALWRLERDPEAFAVLAAATRLDAREQYFKGVTSPIPDPKARRRASFNEDAKRPRLPSEYRKLLDWIKPAGDWLRIRVAALELRPKTDTLKRTLTL
ncbi:MAG: HEAT repeat domain-containing protein, partial [Planctomycetales bacterium]